MNTAQAGKSFSDKENAFSIEQNLIEFEERLEIINEE